MRKNRLSLFILAAAAMLSVFASCNKLSKATTAAATLPNTPDSIVLKSRVIVIDSTRLILVSTPDQLNQGIYAYTSNTGFPGFIAGDIIIGITGAGYLRNVTAVTTGQSQVILTTAQGKLEDVFQQANINFSIGIINMDGGYQYNMTNVPLLQDGTTTATITNGTIAINPDWNFNMQFQSGVLTGFSAICQNGTLNANVQMNIAATAADNINASTTLNAVSGRNIIWFGQLPIVVTTNLSYAANLIGNVSGSTNRTVSYTANDTYTLGDTYASGGWQSQYSFAHNATLTASATSTGSSIGLSCSIAPQLSVLLYGVQCPAAAIGMTTYESGNVAGSGDWDFTAGFYQQPSFGVSAAILGYNVADNSNNWTTDTVSYKTPYKVVKVSGDGQVGSAYQYLAQPLIVQVVDNNGAAQANVPVYFSVTSGGGSLSNYTVMTNSSGLAQTSWLIGNPATMSQGVQAMVKMANGTQISGSPVTFSAL